jgi:hypothetical protein
MGAQRYNFGFCPQFQAKTTYRDARALGLYDFLRWSLFTSSKHQCIHVKLLAAITSAHKNSPLTK